MHFHRQIKCSSGLFGAFSESRQMCWKRNSTKQISFQTFSQYLFHTKSHDIIIILLSNRYSVNVIHGVWIFASPPGLYIHRTRGRWHCVRVLSKSKSSTTPPGSPLVIVHGKALERVFLQLTEPLGDTVCEVAKGTRPSEVRSAFFSRGAFKHE